MIPSTIIIVGNGEHDSKHRLPVRCSQSLIMSCSHSAQDTRCSDKPTNVWLHWKFKTLLVISNSYEQLLECPALYWVEISVTKFTLDYMTSSLVLHWLLYLLIIFIWSHDLLLSFWLVKQFYFNTGSNNSNMSSFFIPCRSISLLNIYYLHWAHVQMLKLRI